MAGVETLPGIALSNLYSADLADLPSMCRKFTSFRRTSAKLVAANLSLAGENDDSATQHQWRGVSILWHFAERAKWQSPSLARISLR